MHKLCTGGSLGLDVIRVDHGQANWGLLVGERMGGGTTGGEPAGGEGLREVGLRP